MKMMKFNKFISIVLSLIIVLSIVANAAATNVHVFKDSDSNYLKFISGFGDGTIRPDAPLTRAQCATMLTNIIDVKASDNCPFTDVHDDFWAHDAICTLNNAGIIVGYSNGLFLPNKNITRAEFVTIISRIAELKQGKASFSDINGHWAYNEIVLLSANEYINGYKDGTFRPDASITRAEAVKIINRLVETKINKEETRELFSDLPGTHWAYYEIMSAASTFSFDSAIKHRKINYNEIEYIEINVGAIENELNTILDEFVSAPVERQAEIFNRISVIESDVALAIAMSNINYQRNVTSEKDRNNLANHIEISNVIIKAKEKRYKFLSVVKVPEIFEEKIGMKISDIPKPDESAPDRLVALYTEEQKYENEFNTFMYEGVIVHNGNKYSLSQSEYSNDPILKAKALNYYLENRIDYGTIFSKLINVRTRIANFFGYRYYTDIGYMRAGKFYYTPEDAAVIRADVKKYIAPLVYNITRAAQGHDNGYYNLNTPTKYQVPNEPALYMASNFMRQLSPQTRQAFDYIKYSNLIDYEMRENKATTSFTSYVPEYDIPYIFINSNGGVDDIENFSHEFGHAFHSFRIGESGISCPYDVAEVASYGMEMLSLHNYDYIFGPDSADKERMINFYSKLRTILLSTFMDEFQYMVYKDTLLTIDERNALYIKLYKEYFPGTNFNHDAYNKGIIWTNPTHIFTQPYYSIDYTLALTVAFQLWEIGETQGVDAQFETYMGIIESPYVNTSIHSVSRSAGLQSPFSNGIIKGISEKIDTMFKEKYTETH